MESRIVTNDEFVEAQKNRNYQALIARAVGYYKNFIPRDELNTIKLMALWDFLVKYDGRTRESTYLTLCVKWRCKSFLEKEFKYISLFTQPKYEITIEKEAIPDDIPDLLKTLLPKYGKVILQKFYYNMTLTEIGNANGYSYQTAKNYIDHALGEIKIELCGKS